MVQDEQEPVSKPKRSRKLMITKSVAVDLGPKNKKPESQDFLICDDCKHNTITYEPSQLGVCYCGCH